ncbi:MAG TPA: 50S ribosomal protein L11 methyltransferase [Caldimonas sp.]|nr:50S ribosomal protein L11 methyltransferase [Caldimonas sp.]
MHALTLLADAGSVDALSERLAVELDALSVSVEDADAGTPAEQPVFDEPGTAAAPGWRHARVTALFVDETAATAAAAAISASAIGSTDRVESIDAVDDRDWVRLTQSQFGPIEIASGFWIVPTWSPVPPTARQVIRLDPGMAFGTGTHPTTRMCLRWIVQAAARARHPWRSVLDYGCGSGVLAIAAALLGAESVEAVDIDPAAVEATAQNARFNGVSIRAGQADRLAVEPRSLVVANILATPLKLLAPVLAAQLAPAGELVLSGILERQAGELRAAYASWLDLDVTASDDGWILMTGTRTGECRVA